jgi:hypothetical protein
MDSEDAIEREFKARQLSYIDAIERLQAIGLEPIVAERRVCEWEGECGCDNQWISSNN